MADIVVRMSLAHPHRRRSGWNSGGGRMASTEGGSLPSGMGMGRDVPSPAD